MKIQTEKPMTIDTAYYILDSRGWKHIEGINGDEVVISVRAEDNSGHIAEYNRFNKNIYINTEMHTQELLAILTIFRAL